VFKPHKPGFIQTAKRFYMFPGCVTPTAPQPNKRTIYKPLYNRGVIAVKRFIPGVVNFNNGFSIETFFVFRSVLIHIFSF
jgi:hypothetical protein